MDGSLPCELFLSHMGSCLPADIFFLIGKHTEIYIYIYEKKKRVPEGQPKAYREYARGAKKHEQKRRGGTKKYTPVLIPYQSKKLIKGKGPSSIIDLVQDQKLHTEEFFIL